MDMMKALGHCSSSSGLTKGQVADVLIKYLKDHPESRHEPAASLAFQAFSTAFGCKSR
jgi:Rap1a immunity proteins